MSSIASPAWLVAGVDGLVSPLQEILERQLSFHLDAHGVGRLAFRSLAVRYFLQILCVPMHKAAVLSTDAGWSNSRER
jgi:hypothetical protein